MKQFYLGASIAAVMALATTTSAQSPAFTTEQRAEGEAKVQAAATYLARNMRDPSSVTFRNVFIQKRVTDDGREPVTLCGEVNGRNGYGGYTGFQAFTLVGENVEVGKVLGMDVAFLCRNRNPIIDPRDYSPEMRAAFAAAAGG